MITSSGPRFAAELLQESGNEVRIVSQLNSGVAYSLIFLDSIEVEYQRRYEAVNGELFLTNDEYEPRDRNRLHQRRCFGNGYNSAKCRTESTSSVREESGRGVQRDHLNRTRA